MLVSADDLAGRYLAEDIVNLETGEIYGEAGDELDAKLLETLHEAKVKEFPILDIDHVTIGAFIRNTLNVDKNSNHEEALMDVYRVMRPGEPPTLEAATALFHGLFFDSERYDLSAVGRVKMNMRLDLKAEDTVRTLRKEDILAVIKTLVDLRDGKGEIDDIDHLGNRRVRSVGELMENQYRLGLLRMERAIKERMSSVDIDTVMPQDLINAKPAAAAVREFFGSSQLSQFMDQTNPLSEITHKRRLSALGPGGLTRERAGFEVRDVHPTHYGRICPIETPEGPNIGLINSLATFARVNKYGFIESPYRKVVNGKLTDQVVYLSAMEEMRHHVAQANAEIDAKGKLTGDLITCRFSGRRRARVARQGRLHRRVAEAARLRRRGADPVPRERRRQPRADGLEHAASGGAADQGGGAARRHRHGRGRGARFRRRDRRTPHRRRRSGRRHPYRHPRDRGDGSVEARRRHLPSAQVPALEPEHLHQPAAAGARGRSGRRPARSSPTVLRPISASWRSARTCSSRSCRGWATTSRTPSSSPSASCRDDVFTSIHIEEFEVMARDTKLGPEEITRDIPNVSEEALKNLDEAGIVYIGAEVNPGDILVGKITPKGESPMTPEEKLLRAIFGEKASDVRDTSLRAAARRVGHGRRGARVQPARRREGRARHGDRARGDRASRQGPRRRARRSSTATSMAVSRTC